MISAIRSRHTATVAPSATRWSTVSVRMTVGFTTSVVSIQGRGSSLPAALDEALSPANDAFKAVDAVHPQVTGTLVTAGSLHCIGRNHYFIDPNKRSCALHIPSSCNNNFECMLALVQPCC
jgi:hypothetical protein